MIDPLKQHRGALLEIKTAPVSRGRCALGDYPADCQGDFCQGSQNQNDLPAHHENAFHDVSSTRSGFPALTGRGAAWPSSGHRAVTVACRLRRPPLLQGSAETIVTRGARPW